MIRRPPRSPLFPYTPLSRSSQLPAGAPASMTWYFDAGSVGNSFQEYLTIQNPDPSLAASITITYLVQTNPPTTRTVQHTVDRKSTRLNSSHLVISYAVFCLK